MPIHTEPYSMWCFFDLFHLACVQGISLLKYVAILYSYLWPRNIPLYWYAIFVCPFISWWTFGLFPPFSDCELCQYENPYTSFHFNTCMVTDSNYTYCGDYCITCIQLLNHYIVYLKPTCYCTSSMLKKKEPTLRFIYIRSY